MRPPSPSRRLVEPLLFGLVLLGAAYFHQGGGWNQNIRFAQVRAIVEERTFSVDAYLVYARRADAVTPLARLPVRAGVFTSQGVEYALAWRPAAGDLVPVEPRARDGLALVDLEEVAVSGDVAYRGGHFYPNKPPGASVVAVPGYALAYALERVFGVDPDRWWVLTLNAWLAAVLGVGLVTALGAVLVFRLAGELASERDAVLTALVFAFGTMTWPHATLLVDHNVVAIALLATFYAIERARPRAGRAGLATAGAAGLCAGYAVTTNYAMAPVLAVFGFYAFVRLGWKRSLAFGLGAVAPLALLGWYHHVCFGVALTTANAYQNPLFVAAGRLEVAAADAGGAAALAVRRAGALFQAPRLDVLLILLFSPVRGLFFTSPVLLLTVPGLVALFRAREQRARAALCLAVIAYMLLLNISFEAWDGGWTAVPRYLGPAMPFFVLPIAALWGRWPRVVHGLAVAATAVQLAITAVDPQVPIGNFAVSGAPPGRVWTLDPLSRYVLPLFVRERAWPMLDDQIEAAVVEARRAWAGRGIPASEREALAARLGAELRARVARADPEPFPLAAVRGPVSVNPIGIVEGGYYRLAPAGSAMAALSSFNVGELLAPQSRWSLLPFLLAAAGAVGMLLRATSEGDATVAASPGRRRRR